MKERRDFLKAASLLPLTVTESIASSANPETPAQQSPGNPAPPAPDVPLPKGAPVQERQFPNYHLLGSPEPNGNLLGGTRPRDWQTTKSELLSALRDAAQPDDPIHNWLNTFRLTFDDRATAIVLGAVSTLKKSAAQPNLVYEPQLYDVSLRGAAGLLDRCLRYRNEMGAFEQGGINAGISYLAFLKIKPLQRNMIIQSSTADVADIEQVTQSNASHRYRDAKGLDKLFDKYHLQGLRIETEGGAAEAELVASKDRLRTRLLERQFHIQVDAQLAQFTRLLTSGSTANFAERYLRMHALLTEDLADAYRKLYSASQGVQQVLGMTTVTPGTGTPVSVDIPPFADAAALKDWVRGLIPPAEGDQRKPDVLDAMVIWTRAVMRELDTRSQYETEFTASIPLSQPWGKNKKVLVSTDVVKTAFGGATPSVTFSLDTDSLPYATLPQYLRVIGVGVTVQHNADDFSPPQYADAYDSTPYQSHDPDPSPKQKTDVKAIEAVKMARLNATVATPPQKLKDLTYMRPTIYLSNVRIQGGGSGDAEAALSFDPGCRNLSPVGSWTITFDPNALEFFASPTQVNDSWVAGLILHLRMRGMSA